MTERSAAEVRRQWMRIYGCDEDEILESMEVSPPTDISEEELQLDNMIKVCEANAVARHIQGR